MASNDLIPTLEDLAPIGVGLHRPEDAAIDRDGRVFASDANAAVSEVLADGSLRPIGKAGGEPNGINLTPDGRSMLIANFALHILQQLDLESGEVTTVCDAIDGMPLRNVNYPIVSSDGTIFCSCSSQKEDFAEVAIRGDADGYIFRITPDGETSIVADEVAFPNALALDADERYLYCARTNRSDVVRFPIEAGGLGAQETWGPPMGDRTESGDDAVRTVWRDHDVRALETADPMVLARWQMVDGIALDAAGNVWVTVIMPGLIKVITPEHEVVTIAEDPTMSTLITPTSVNFGGPDLRDVYIGSLYAPFLVKGKSSIPGVPMAGQR